MGWYRELGQGERRGTYSEHLWFGGAFSEVVFRGDVWWGEANLNFFCQGSMAWQH